MPLFEEQVSRKPNLYPWTQEIIDALWTSHWTPNEFNFRSDYAQFHSDLTDEERGVVVRTLSAIGQIEIAVKRFWGDLGKNFPHPSMTDMGFVMANNEVIHNQAYEKLLEVLRLQSAFDDALKEPVVKGRVEYLRKYLDHVYADKKKQYIYAIILFTLMVENTSLFGQFYTIMHFNRFNNVLKDTAQQVQYTRNEEMLHAKAGIMIINTLRAEYPEYFDDELEARIAEEVRVAVAHEGKIIDWMLQGYEGEALSADILKAFIKNRLNAAMDEIGFAGVALTAEERALLPKTRWMDEETLGGSLTDFFQKRPVEYAKSHRTYDEDDMF
ncbi:ribonucleotide reductase of class Ia (aerobic) beta subunit [Roseobacter phage DSS3P8]|nr:ribonucleotide reductase of class Ia (aerobic) beta subunit [Roseobacter phage DSS3P8]